MRGRAIYLDAPGIRRALHHVGFEACAVADIVDLDLLVRQQMRQVHQTMIYGDAAYVVQIGGGDRRPMDLRIEKRKMHVASLVHRPRNPRNVVVRWSLTTRTDMKQRR